MAGKASRLVGAWCCYCRRSLDPADSGTDLAATIDHVAATAVRAARGWHGSGGWVPCCRRCNHLKGSLHVNEWFWFIQNHARYWKVFTTDHQVRMVIVAERSRRAYAGTAPLSRELMVWRDFNGIGRIDA